VLVDHFLCAMHFAAGSISLDIEKRVP